MSNRTLPRHYTVTPTTEYLPTEAKYIGRPNQPLLYQISWRADPSKPWMKLKKSAHRPQVWLTAAGRDRYLQKLQKAVALEQGKTRPRISVTSIDIIEVHTWNECVETTYGRPYNLWAQMDIRNTELLPLIVPADPDYFERDSIPEMINGDEAGVSLKAWLERSPTAPVGANNEPWGIEIFWHRNFYPSVFEIANDLHKKGILPRGNYYILFGAI